jgi:hypothetical protein
MTKVLMVAFCGLTLLATTVAVSACTCRHMEGNCVKQGGSQAACKQAQASCERTKTFVGPVTGRTWTTNGTDKDCPY